MIRSWVGHDHGSESLAIVADGTLIATGGVDHIIRFWDPITGEKKGELTGHTNMVRSLAFSADGSRLASISGDFRRKGEARIWDVATQQELLTFPLLKRGLDMYLAFTQDGRKVACANVFGSVRVWDASSSP